METSTVYFYNKNDKWIQIDKVVLFWGDFFAVFERFLIKGVALKTPFLVRDKNLPQATFIGVAAARVLTPHSFCVFILKPKGK